MSYKDDIPLGKSTDYCFKYNASVLYPISRCEGRKQLGIENGLPFYGMDLWTAYEFSWLNANGLPQVAIVEFVFPCASAKLIESKSFKLYLNTYNQTIFENQQSVIETLQTDLSIACEDTVEVRMFLIDEYSVVESLKAQSIYKLIDDQQVSCNNYLPEPSLLKCSDRVVEKKLCSHLFRSLCPVTGQPDWASFYISYRGKQMDERSLLQYLVSYRNHQGFHEQCVEQVFLDLANYCEPQELTVYARFLRRGGLDINPLRSSSPVNFPALRESRQ